MAVGIGRQQHNPAEPGSNTAMIHVVERVGDGQHKHPNVTSDHIAFARKVFTSKKHKTITGEPMRYSYNPMMSCCGIALANLTVGATYDDAR